MHRVVVVVAAVEVGRHDRDEIGRLGGVLGVDAGGAEKEEGETVTFSKEASILFTAKRSKSLRDVQSR